MKTITEILTTTLAGLGIDTATPDGRFVAKQIEATLQVAFIEASAACTRLAESYEEQARGLTRAHAKKGQKLIERATGAYVCASAIRKWRTTDAKSGA